MKYTNHLDGKNRGTAGWIFSKWPAAFLVFLLSLPFGPGITQAQDGEHEKKQEEKKKVEIPLPMQDESEELIQRIREGMKKIDENLLGATAREIPEKLKDNIRYIEELLKNTRDQSSQVIHNLDELIKSMKYGK